MTVLVVDDEPGVCWAIRKLLEREGHTAIVAATIADGLRRVREDHPDLVFLDVRLPDGSGLDALERIGQEDPAPAVIVMTAHGDVGTAVEAMRLGAQDYLPKPLDRARVIAAATAALGDRSVAREIDSLRERAAADADVAALSGRSVAMQEVYKMIGTVGPSDASVLIEGESGTGKEMVARAIHQASPRRDGPFEPVTCASIPEALLESELYGHERGAFTGAVEAKPGKVERADGGTLFLDEVSEIPPAAQVKLLRFLQERELERVGGRDRRRVDVRVVAATNVDLGERVREGAFREDLYYRLKVVGLTLPALRDRREDVPLLVARFLAEENAAQVEVSTAALDALLRFDWPGNVRELRNAIQHAVVLARGGVILPEHLPESVRSVAGGEAQAGPLVSTVVRALVERHREETSGGKLLAIATDVWERPLVEEILRRTGGNQVRASKWLGIHRSTLRTKLRRWRDEDAAQAIPRST